MRQFREPTAKNILREPLIFGVPVPSLIGLSLSVLGLQIVIGDHKYSSVVLLGFTSVAYGSLYLATRFAKNGWMEEFFFKIEKPILQKKEKLEKNNLFVELTQLDVLNPDAMDEGQLLLAKSDLAERLKTLKTDDRILYFCEKKAIGAVTSEYFEASLPSKKDSDLFALIFPRLSREFQCYSLYQLPTTTDPLWLFAILSKLDSDFQVLVSFRGLNPHKIKTRIEASRKRNAQMQAVSNIDSDVTFEEASLVLEEISRGEEAVVEMSLVILTQKEIDLDPRYFCKEKDKSFAFYSVLGLGYRFHRPHFVRTVSGADLIPNILDPYEKGSAPILKTTRGTPLYFNPQDSRLEALHWLVVGASGSGKSFLTGLILKRLLEQGVQMSVLFVDHNRSFRRLVQQTEKRRYFEPSSFADLKERFPSFIEENLGQVGTMSGVELSDLSLDEKKVSVHTVLQKIEQFLRDRSSIYPIYIVLDECWNFMRDEPLLVQRAFREFRKLNGAAVAITQSLSDFLMDESGRSIFQNAPIRIILRQGEDLAPYQGVLGLNSVELIKVRMLRQKKGEYSECLIKTPFASQLGRLHPTEEEHDILRSDNIRQELVAEFSKQKGAVCLKN